MSEESTSKSGNELVKRAERGRLVAGTASLNPLGRPKRGMSLSDMARHRCDWPKMVDRLQRIVLSAKSADRDAIAAFITLADRGFGKPLSSLDVNITAGVATLEGDAYAHLSLDRRREILAELRGDRVLELIDDGDDEQGIRDPAVSDDDHG